MPIGGYQESFFFLWFFTSTERLKKKIPKDNHINFFLPLWNRTSGIHASIKYTNSKTTDFSPPFPHLTLLSYAARKPSSTSRGVSKRASRSAFLFEILNIWDVEENTVLSKMAVCLCIYTKKNARKKEIKKWKREIFFKKMKKQIQGRHDKHAPFN